MPADYSSTARALSLPVSPPQSPRPQDRPQWSQARSTSSVRRRRSSFQRPPESFFRRIARQSDEAGWQVIKLFMMMSPLQKVAAVVALLAMFVLGILFLVYNERFFAWLAPVAENWRNLRGGWLIIFVMIFICAFPPMIGYSTSMTIAGFVYGFPKGWIIVAVATVIGSFCAFITSRTIFSKYAERLVAGDKRFNALALTLKHDGLKLLVMIRLCPLPYSLSNGAMSTFPTVDPLMYALATAISTPRAMIPVFIGGRLGQLAETGGKMDAKTRAINYISIAIGAIIAVAVAWFIYQKTMARARQLESEGGNANREEPEDGSFMDDPEANIGDADLRGADDISLAEGEYRDDWIEDGEDVNRRWERDEEDSIGIDKSPRSPDIR
ncbi:MAG: intercellular trafficking and secretion [Chaenotheca gracillima]|nr:MAG: intercellular trafficking and secretion [Chaenotheca gracillima]